jgi:hypothetical protein
VQIVADVYHDPVCYSFRDETWKYALHTEMNYQVVIPQTGLQLTSVEFRNDGSN